MTRREAELAVAELDHHMDIMLVLVRECPWLAFSAFPVWCLGRMAGGLLRWLLRFDWPWEAD